MNCIFCNYKEDEVIYEGEFVVCLTIPEKVLIGSCIIIPKTHRETVFDLSDEEWAETRTMITKVKKYLDSKFEPEGYNLGWNVGKVGGQEIFHAHLHIIPRYKNEPYAGKGIRHWLKKSNNKYLHKNIIRKQKHRPVIFSVAAISGGGKTTLTEYLCSELTNSKAVYFDDYEYDKQPLDIGRWVDEGCDMNEWDLTKFENKIKSILDADTVDYIILDYPFSYQNKQIAQYIDLAFFIDTPPDIALSRRIIRDNKDKNKDDIINELNNYIHVSREYYITPENTINMKTDSDIIIGDLNKIEV